MLKKIYIVNEGLLFGNYSGEHVDKCILFVYDREIREIGVLYMYFDLKKEVGSYKKG